MCKEELARFIDQTPLVDSHEHQNPESLWVEKGPADVLADLLDSYVKADFISAGCDPETYGRAMSPGDMTERWSAIEKYWQRVRHGGYGRATAHQARLLYGIEEITATSLTAAQPKIEAIRRPGHRLRLLKEVANLDHVQSDLRSWRITPDESGPEYFFSDLAWRPFVCGAVDIVKVETDSGVRIHDLASYRQAMESLFAQFGPLAIAVKTSHAYERSLQWVERADREAEAVLTRHLRGEMLNPEERLCLGDWSLARGVELAIEHNLPVKFHTGYQARNWTMILEHLQPGHLAPLAIRYPEAKLILLHTAYPYSEEVITLAKHFPNVYADMSWVWAINPRAAGEFFRRYLHAAPINKLLIFGGDGGWPTSTVAYAHQTRSGLAAALASEVNDEELTLEQAGEVAQRVMSRNHYELFDIPGRRRALTAAMRSAADLPAGARQ